MREDDRLPRFDPYSIPRASVQQPDDPISDGKRMRCPFCVRRPTIVGFGQHMLDFHADKWRKA